MSNFLFNPIVGNKKFISIFIVVVFFAFFPFAISNVFSLDDYHLFYNSIDSEKITRFSFESGRWFSVLMLKLFSFFIGESGFKGLYLSNFLVFIQMVFGGYIIAKQYQLNMNKWYTPVIVALGFIHIFCSEIMTFKFGLMVNIGFSLLYLIAFGSWYISKTFNWKFLLAIVGIILALASYQVIVNVLLVITLAGFLIEINQISREKGTLNLNYLKNSEYTYKLLAIIIGTIAYYFLNKLVLSFFDVSISNRSSFLPISKLSERIGEIATVFKMVLYDGHAFLIPKSTKLITLMIVFLAFLTGIKNIIRNQKSLVWTLLFMIIFVLTLLSSAFASLFLETWWMVPRMFTGYSFFIMMCFIIVLTSYQLKLVKILGMVFLSALTFSFISVNHNIANDQAYLNQLDRNKAQRLIVDLEKIDSFKTKRTYIHQRPNCWANEYNIKTMYGDMNMSAFCTSWSKYELMQFVAGYPLNRTTEEENQEIISVIENKKDSSIYNWSERRGVYSKNDVIYIFP
jgi:hypothetical protein